MKNFDLWVVYYFIYIDVEMMRENNRYQKVSSGPTAQVPAKILVVQPFPAALLIIVFSLFFSIFFGFLQQLIIMADLAGQ